MVPKQRVWNVFSSVQRLEFFFFFRFTIKAFFVKSKIFFLKIAPTTNIKYNPYIPVWNHSLGMNNFLFLHSCTWQFGINETFKKTIHTSDHYTSCKWHIQYVCSKNISSSGRWAEKKRKKYIRDMSREISSQHQREKANTLGPKSLKRPILQPQDKRKRRQSHLQAELRYFTSHPHFWNHHSSGFFITLWLSPESKCHASPPCSCNGLFFFFK